MSRFGHILFWNGICVGEWKREDWPRFLWRRECTVFSWTGPPMPTINIRAYLVWTIIRYRLNFVLQLLKRKDRRKKKQYRNVRRFELSTYGWGRFEKYRRPRRTISMYKQHLRLEDPLELDGTFFLYKPVRKYGTYRFPSVLEILTYYRRTLDSKRFAA